MQLSANFSSLQSEYDNAQDTIEALKKENAEVTKDLKQNLEQYTDTKLNLAEMENQLNQTRAKNLDLETNLEKHQEESKKLALQLKEKVSKLEG